MLSHQLYMRQHTGGEAMVSVLLYSELRRSRPPLGMPSKKDSSLWLGMTDIPKAGKQWPKYALRTVIETWCQIGLESMELRDLTAFEGSRQSVRYNLFSDTNLDHGMKSNGCGGKPGRSRKGRSSEMDIFPSSSQTTSKPFFSSSLFTTKSKMKRTFSAVNSSRASVFSSNRLKVCGRC